MREAGKTAKRNISSKYTLLHQPYVQSSRNSAVATHDEDSQHQRQKNKTHVQYIALYSVVLQCMQCIFVTCTGQREHDAFRTVHNFSFFDRCTRTTLQACTQHTSLSISNILLSFYMYMRSDMGALPHITTPTLFSSGCVYVCLHISLKSSRVYKYSTTFRLQIA